MRSLVDIVDTAAASATQPIIIQARSQEHVAEWSDFPHCVCTVWGRRGAEGVLVHSGLRLRDYQRHQTGRGEPHTRGGGAGLRLCHQRFTFQIER